MGVLHRSPVGPHARSYGQCVAHKVSFHLLPDSNQVSSIILTLKMKCLTLSMLVLMVTLATVTEARRRKAGGVCGLTCFRWKKCKGKLATLTSGGGATRPGQRGTTGQLIFNKCEDPPEKCKCELEEPKPTGSPKPSIPKVMLEYVDSDAMDWLTNLGILTEQHQTKPRL